MMRSSCDDVPPKIFRAEGSSTIKLWLCFSCLGGRRSVHRACKSRNASCPIVNSCLCGFGLWASVLHSTAPWHASQHCMAASCLVVRQPAQPPLTNVSPRPLLSDAAPRMSCAQPCVAPWTGHSSCLTALPNRLSDSQAVPRPGRRHAAPLDIVFLSTRAHAHQARRRRQPSLVHTECFLGSGDATSTGGGKPLHIPGSLSAL